MFPNLPTDHIYKFLCIAGLLVVVLTNIGIYNLNKEFLNTSKNYMTELKTSMSTFKKSMDTGSGTDSLDLEIFQLEQKAINDHYKNARNSIDERKADYRELGWIGMGIFCAFIVFWNKHQSQLDKITDKEVQKASRLYTVCQSCSVNLQLLDINAGKIYCNRCHNGYSFTEQDLTFGEMKVRVQLKMESDGCGKEATEKQIKKIGRLYRWNNEFKWD